MGTLMYGAGHVWAGHAHFYLHDHELSRSPPDESFIDMLKQNCCLSGPHFPPPAIVEALQDYVTNYHKVRRLHLIVVDLWRPWKYNTARAREITDQLWRISECDDTRPVLYPHAPLLSIPLYPPLLLLPFLPCRGKKRGKKNWVASLGILSGSSSGRSSPLSLVSRSFLFILHPALSPTSLILPHILSTPSAAQETEAISFWHQIL